VSLTELNVSDGKGVLTVQERNFDVTTKAWTKAGYGLCPSILYPDDYPGNHQDRGAEQTDICP
jgi:hypothetical protein